MKGRTFSKLQTSKVTSHLLSIFASVDSFPLNCRIRWFSFTQDIDGQVRLIHLVRLVRLQTDNLCLYDEQTVNGLNKSLDFRFPYVYIYIYIHTMGAKSIVATFF